MVAVPSHQELRTLMAVPGRRGSVPTDLNIEARDAPLPWGSGLGTLRVLPRKPRLNPPGFEPPGSDMLCVSAYGRMGMAVAPDPGLLHTRRPRTIRDWGLILGPHPAGDRHPPTLEGEPRSA